MKKNETAKETVKTGHTTNQVKSAKEALSGLIRSGGKLIDFFRSAYAFNKLGAKSESAAFQAVNSACYAELGVSKSKSPEQYAVAKVQASKAKAELMPKKTGAKKGGKAAKNPAVETSPSEAQEKAFIATNPVDLLANVVSRMRTEKKMSREEVEQAVKAAIERVYKSR